MVCKLSYSQSASYSQTVPKAINHRGIKRDIVIASRTDSLNQWVSLELSLLLPLSLAASNADKKVEL